VSAPSLRQGEVRSRPDTAAHQQSVQRRHFRYETARLLKSSVHQLTQPDSTNRRKGKAKRRSKLLRKEMGLKVYGWGNAAFE